jgi:hypothetical protein
MSESVEKATKGVPKDDGPWSRKFLTTVIGAGAIWLVCTVLLFFAVLNVNGAADSAVKLGLDAALWSSLSKTLLLIAVAGYGIINVAEKHVLTKNK